jgi:hypothetical protein
LSKGRSTFDVPLSTVTQVTCLGTVVLPVCSNSDASGFRQYRLPKRLPQEARVDQNRTLLVILEVGGFDAAVVLFSEDV